jgi:N-acetylglucosaminyldiphosphoundecaprenol N-acetyl-beta-D-mannosaminyltransferase
MCCSDQLETVIVGGLPLVRTCCRGFVMRMIGDWRRQQAAGRTLPAKVSFSANGQIIAEVNRQADVRGIYSQADTIDADGMPLVLASRLLTTTPLPERIATTDFFHDAAKAAEVHGLSFYLLGGSPENNRRVCAKLKALYPRLRLAGSHHGYFSAEEERPVVNDIQQAKPDVLWVGMGHPRQEQFVLRHREVFRGITWVKTCGGLYEHILGLHPRAPLWMQTCGLEWLYRLLCEPRRLLWRYLTTNPLAVWYLLTRTKRVPQTVGMK